MLPTVSTVETFRPSFENDRKESCGGKSADGVADTQLDGKWMVNMPNTPGPPAARQAVAASNDTIFVVGGMTSWEIIDTGAGEEAGRMFTDATYTYNVDEAAWSASQ